MSPESTAQIAARAKLHLVTCELGLGQIRKESCAARWLVACGKAPGPASIRDSRCKGCQHGQRRHAELTGRKRKAMEQRLGQPRRVAKAPSGPKVRTCDGPGCSVTFEVNGPEDGNKRYHDAACKDRALELQRQRRRKRPPKATGAKARPTLDGRCCTRCGIRLAIGAPCTRCASVVAVESAISETAHRRVG